MASIFAAVVALGVGWVDASVPSEVAAFLTDKVVPTDACLESMNTSTSGFDIVMDGILSLLLGGGVA